MTAFYSTKWSVSVSFTRRYSGGGRLLAVAVNQRHWDVNRLVYLGGEAGGAVLVADLRGPAAATDSHGSHQRSVGRPGPSHSTPRRHRLPQTGPDGGPRWAPITTCRVISWLRDALVA